MQTQGHSCESIYAKLVKDFDYLSVREDNGQKWLKELTGIEVPIVADPTVLLTGNEWCEKLNIPEVDGNFILYYAFYYSNEENNKILKEVSEKYNIGKAKNTALPDGATRRTSNLLLTRYSRTTSSSHRPNG